MKAGLWASLAGTVVLVAWGMLFWAVLYDPLKVYADLPQGVSEAAAVLERTQVPTGTYFFPWPRNTSEARASWQAAHAKGPFFQLSYVREGVNPDAPGKLALGLGHYFAVAALAWALCRITRAQGSRALLVVLMGGLIGSLYTELSAPIWFALPWHSAWLLFGYDTMSWLLLGGVLAVFTRRFATRDD